MDSYEETADELANRILALIPGHLEILSISDPFELFRVEGFSCKDLEPSFAQACWSLGNAKKLYYE